MASVQSGVVVIVLPLKESMKVNLRNFALAAALVCLGFAVQAQEPAADEPVSGTLSEGAAASCRPESGVAKAREMRLKISMDWDEAALTMVGKAPWFVRKRAMRNVEEFARGKGHDCITVEVVEKQMESAGLGRFKQAPESD